MLLEIKNLFLGTAVEKIFITKWIYQVVLQGVRPFATPVSGVKAQEAGNRAGSDPFKSGCCV